MAKKINLDLSGVSVFGAKTVVPAGRYYVSVADASAEQNKAKNGGFIKVTFEIKGGEFDGSILIDRFNIQNQNEDAVRIGLSKIKAVLTHGGYANPNKLGDPSDMVGLSLDLLVTEDPHSFKGTDGNMVETTQNNIQGFFPVRPVSEIEKEEKKVNPAKDAKPQVTEEKAKPEAEANSEFPWA